MTSTFRGIFFWDCHNFGFLVRELGDALFGFMDDFYRNCGECIVSRGGRIQGAGIGHESFSAFDVAGERVNQAVMIGHHRGGADPVSVWEVVSSNA
jgi:hypothetical protein